MKRFLIFGITEFSDINAGARGYLGQFESFEELIGVLSKNKEKILDEYIKSFNVLDLQYDEIIVNGEYDYWELIDINNNSNDFKFDNDELCILNKRIQKRMSPVSTYLNQLKFECIEDEVKEKMLSLTKEDLDNIWGKCLGLFK